MSFWWKTKKLEMQDIIIEFYQNQKKYNKNFAYQLSSPLFQAFAREHSCVHPLMYTRCTDCPLAYDIQNNLMEKRSSIEKISVTFKFYFFKIFPVYTHYYNLQIIFMWKWSFIEKIYFLNFEFYFWLSFLCTSNDIVSLLHIFLIFNFIFL